MSGDFNESDKEILEVERRLVERVERLGHNWQDLRSATSRKYAFPAMVAAAAIGALAIGAVVRKGRHTPAGFRLQRADEKTTLIAKLFALASLVSTLRRLPIGPLAGAAMEWLRRRRRDADTNSRASPMSRQNRPW